MAALIRGVLVLSVVVLVFAGLVRACTFAPGAPEVDRDALPRVDAPAALARAATGVGFAVRVPVLGPDWISQSQDVVPVGAGRGVRVGWVTPGNEFARLVQTDGPADAAVVAERGDPAPRGTVPAGGRTWTVHSGIRGEPVWVTDVDGVRLLVTGSAPPPELTRLAEAALAAPPLPRR